LRPGHTDALIQRAHASFELHEWGAAAEQYSAALEVKPKDTTLWTSMTPLAVASEKKNHSVDFV